MKISKNKEKGRGERRKKSSVTFILSLPNEQHILITLRKNFKAKSLCRKKYYFFLSNLILNMSEKLSPFHLYEMFRKVKSIEMDMSDLLGKNFSNWIVIMYNSSNLLKNNCALKTGLLRFLNYTSI